MPDEVKQLDKSILKISFSMLWKYIICLTMSFIITLALGFVFTSMTVTETGYTVYGVNEQGEAEELYTHMLSDGEDERLKQYEDEGREIRVVNNYTELGGAPKVVMLILSQICTMGTLIMFIHPVSYNIGDSDSNKVQFGRIKYDRFKGFKLGVIPAAFALVPYLLLILGKVGIIGDIALAIYRFTNYHLVAYNEVVFAGVSRMADVSWVSVVAAVLTVAVVPVLSHISYTLGFKRINLFEKIVFKKK